MSSGKPALAKDSLNVFQAGAEIVESLGLGGALSPPLPYSPDISPCDYDLIPKMPMRGKRYRTIEDVKQAAEHSLCTINRLGSANGIQQLLRRWEHVVHNGGDYIEGL